MSGSVQDKPDPGNDGKERLKAKANNFSALGKKLSEENDDMMSVMS